MRLFYVFHCKLVVFGSNSHSTISVCVCVRNSFPIQFRPSLQVWKKKLATEDKHQNFEGKKKEYYSCIAPSHNVFIKLQFLTWDFLMEDYLLSKKYSALFWTLEKCFKLSGLFKVELSAKPKTFLLIEKSLYFDANFLNHFDWWEMIFIKFFIRIAHHTVIRLISILKEGFLDHS